MAARQTRLSVLAALAATAALMSGLAVQGQRPEPRADRVVSVVPALTEALFAIGAGAQVVGVSSYDQFPPEVQALPRVGALLDPNTERILSLRPDLVVVYGSQSELQTQLDRAGVRTFSYRHGGLATVLETIGELGVATGRQADADRVVTSLRRRLDAVRTRVAGRPRPRTLLVFEREVGSLRGVYASGGVGFLHDMLEAAGGDNVFADVARESVQPSIETLLARAPDVILELRTSGLLETREVEREQNVWATLSSVPAIRNNRVHLLTGDYLVVPGPRLAEAVETLARALHPDTAR